MSPSFAEAALPATDRGISSAGFWNQECPQLAQRTMRPLGCRLAGSARYREEQDGQVKIIKRVTRGVTIEPALTMADPPLRINALAVGR
jgi:hypothetical protein